MIFDQCMQCGPHVFVKLQSKLPSSKKDLAEFKDIPAVRSVTEFGYDEKLVREAYETLQKSGKSGM